MSEITAKNETKLSKKDLFTFFIRYLLTGQACQNYETMQSCCVIYTMGPFLERFYGDDPDLLKEKFNTHFQFFNCQTYFGSAIIAAALAIEETKAEGCSSLATAIKTSLMGPFSGIGDALFNTLPSVICASLAAYSAIEGSFITGALLILILCPFFIFIRWEMIKIGYYEGTKFISEKQDQLNNLREAISILGIIIVGAMVASTVSISTPLEITSGDAVQSIQSILDRIVPKLLSVIAVALVYFGLDIKGMNTVKMVWLMIIVVFILASIGLII